MAFFVGTSTLPFHPLQYASSGTEISPVNVPPASGTIFPSVMAVFNCATVVVSVLVPSEILLFVRVSVVALPTRVSLEPVGIAMSHPETVIAPILGVIRAGEPARTSHPVPVEVAPQRVFTMSATVVSSRTVLAAAVIVAVCGTPVDAVVLPINWSCARSAILARVTALLAIVSALVLLAVPSNEEPALVTSPVAVPIVLAVVIFGAETIVITGVVVVFATVASPFAEVTEVTVPPPPHAGVSRAREPSAWTVSTSPSLPPEKLISSALAVIVPEAMSAGCRAESANAPCAVVATAMSPEPRRVVEFTVFMFVPETSVACFSLSSSLRAVCTSVAAIFPAGTFVI